MRQQPTTLNLPDLPDELLCSIFEYLPPSSLRALSLVSTWGYAHATPLLWRSLTLVDKSTPHVVESDEEAMWEGEDYNITLDDHDDTPMIRKLLVLARNRFVASSVQELTHRCHLHPPGIFQELPSISFKTRTLSSDTRTLALLQAAVANMDNVHTLRIIFGHWNITMGLLRGFLGKQRPGHPKLRRLWLENCCLEGIGGQLFRQLTATQLESVRLRRMYVCPAEQQDDLVYIPTRGGVSWHIQNGRGGSQTTTVIYADDHYRKAQLRTQEDNLLRTVVQKYDNQIYRNLIEEGEEMPTWEKLKDSYLRADSLSWEISPQAVLCRILQSASSTLTSLNLDWILWPSDLAGQRMAGSVLAQLAALRFSNLRAFQLRNTVVEQTNLPEGVYLLSEGESNMPSFLDFMEAHSKLRCIGWSMDRFFSHRRQSPEIAARCRAVVSSLAQTLEDIRVDYDYANRGEFLTDNPVTTSDYEVMIRRRKFIEEFACYMTKVEQIKMEGGIPRDEKRETVRALRRCPLRKIVMIGVSCPLGNTWGVEANKLRAVDAGNQAYSGTFEEESEEQIYASTSVTPTLLSHQPFEPVYGWPAGPPMLHTIASYHPHTVTELKFCGYNGSPILYKPSTITNAMLHPLRYFHSLKSLVISMWLLTYFDGEYNDESIIDYWVDQRSPSSTALVAPITEDPLTSWSGRLRTFYAPQALAKQVARQVAPHLSPKAKSQPGGVRVRASFCLGVVTSDIFDLDLRIGRDDNVIAYRGPREEGEEGRRQEKLGHRRWF